MRLKIAILAGDGIGPEVTNEAVSILRAVADAGGHDFTFTPLLIGGIAITETGSPLPPATVEACLESDAVLLGAVGDNKFNALSPDKRPEAGLLAIRQALGGFANLRPSIGYPALAENGNLASPDYVMSAIFQGIGAMPPVGRMMSDAQAADVINYVRTHFGNNYKDKVAPADVKAAR